MLTIKQNLLETIHSGHPDRFVNQYEYLALVMDPISDACGTRCNEGCTRVTDWGVTVSWKEGQPGPFPLLDKEHVLIKDIAKWREILEPSHPNPHSYPESAWEKTLTDVATVDRNNVFVAPFSTGGIFEKLHYFMGMEEALINFYEYPDEMHELIDFLTNWHIDAAREISWRFAPDALFQHDDWGTQTRLLISPEMFREFIKPAYMKLYHFWKDECGIKLIIHHSDSYAAELVPDMIDMGVDIWQGAVTENNIPELLKKYGGKISIQGGLDNGKLDRYDWSKEEITKELANIIKKTDRAKYLIPSFSMGGPGSTYSGAYEYASEEIDRLSKLYFRE